MASTDIDFNGELFRKNHPIIIAQNRHLATINAVRLAYDSGGYLAGQVLARNSTSGYYQDYNDGGSSGTDVAKCVLMNDVPVTDFASTGDTEIARGIFGGEVFYDKLTGIDANGITDLGGRRLIDATGIEILKF